METIKLRLTLDVDINPHGMSADQLKDKLYQTVRYAIASGLLTDGTLAAVEHYTASVKQLRS
jgi:hypothetical protein